MDFDIIPYHEIEWGQRLGSGSFGSVHRGSYLGIEIAIKEVLPSNDYDVHKYFEREWRIMRECRHPNIVLFLGLSKAPDGDDRVFIVSEYVPRGNLRQFILSPYAFPWRLRLSFATDVARAVAYLHARQCIHRDLKGENLLITSNERVKVTDFGFARIASRNEEEMRRMTYCGTDGYMSPEIINGQQFDLPTDVFSLGIIFIEIMCRRLVDSKNFVRQAPSWTPDPEEVRRRVSPNCPPAFTELALNCCAEEPLDRPIMSEVLERLRTIEVEVLASLDADTGEHVGSIRLVHRGKRAMPIFDPPEAVPETGTSSNTPTLADPEQIAEAMADSMGDEDAKIEAEALEALAGLQIDGKGATPAKNTTWRNARWEEGSDSSFYTDASEMRDHQPLIPSEGTFGTLAASLNESVQSALGDKVVGASNLLSATPPTHEVEPISTMTIKGSPEVEVAEGHSPQATPRPGDQMTIPDPPVVFDEQDVTHTEVENKNGVMTEREEISPSGSGEMLPSLSSSELLPTRMRASFDEKGQLQTRYQMEQERKAQVGALGTHRFSLVGKDDVLPAKKGPASFTSTFAFAFLPKVMSISAKCPVCLKKIGPRAALQCDDCSVVVHVKCSHAAPRNCTTPSVPKAP